MEEFFYDTMFGEAEVFILETEDGVPIRVLYVAGGFQSATFLGDDRFEPVFAYYRAIDCVFQAGRPVRRMLMIGGGGFSYPKHLLMSEDPLHEATSIDVVEIDPAIVDIARRHFFLDEVELVHGPDGSGRLRVIVGDGVQVLRVAEPEAYDVVVNDSFDGVDPTGALLDPQVLAQAKRAMTEEGLYLVNAVVEDSEQARPFAQALHAVFSHVYLLRCPDEDFDGSSNNLLIATETPPCLAGLAEL